MPKKHQKEKLTNGMSERSRGREMVKIMGNIDWVCLHLVGELGKALGWLKVWVLLKRNAIQSHVHTFKCIFSNLTVKITIIFWI